MILITMNQSRGEIDSMIRHIISDGERPLDREHGIWACDTPFNTRDNMSTYRANLRQQNRLARAVQ